MAVVGSLVGFVAVVVLCGIALVNGDGPSPPRRMRHYWRSLRRHVLIGFTERRP